MHPVPQGLTVHAAGFGRRFAVHAIEHQRKRKYPTRRGTILLSARRLAKLRSREIKSSDRYRRSHRCRSSQRPASSQSFTDLGIPNESQFRAVGIIPIVIADRELESEKLGGASFHSITSSARPSSVAGISRPSALAAFRLMANSNLVGSWTGRSAGLAPLRMRSI